MLTRRILVYLITFAWLATSGGVTAQPTVVQVNQLDNKPVETSIAINPKNPDNMIGAALTIIGSRSSRNISNYSYVTFDGGKNWTEIPMPNPGERTVQGDDAVCFDAEGNAYRSYISFSGLGDTIVPRHTNGILVSKSTDGGRAWLAPVPVIQHIGTLAPFEDKPYIAADQTSSPHRGNVYVAWTQFAKYGSRAPHDSSYILFSRSTDGGRIFSPPLRVSDVAGDCADSDSTVEGAVPSVGPNGEVYLAWGSRFGIVFDKSLDGGKNFGKDKIVCETPGGWNFNITGLSRCNGMPVTACDISAGKHRGSIYICWSDLRNSDGKEGDADVFLTVSRDGGATWSAPKRVNDDRLRNGRDQFLPWMSVDPTDGSINIAFYDRRDYAGDSTVVYLARSTDGGATFRNTPLPAAPFVPVATEFFGDYLGISAYGGRVVPLWMQFFDSKMGIAAAVIGFTRSKGNK